LDFVELSAIDPHYIDKPYLIAPEKYGKKSYALLREVLKRSGKAGIAKLVLRSRQHLCAVIPHGKALSLLILRFADELRGTSDLELPEENLKKLGITSKELDMAEKLVSGMVDEWQPEKYRDDYRKDLLAMIHARAKAGDVNTVSKEPSTAPRAPKAAKVVDLVSLLAQSMASGRGPSHKKAARKADPHVHGKAPAKKRASKARVEHAHRKSA
jgi:DNA end-binding protein Ku